MTAATLLDAYQIFWRAGLPVGPRDKWLADFRDAVLWPIARGGRYVGMVLLHQVETGQVLIHIGVLPDWRGRWITKAVLRAYPAWCPTCPVYAVIACAYREAHALARRLGFKPYRGAEGHTIYVKEPSDANARETHL